MQEKLFFSDGNYLANKLELQKLASADNETRQKLIQITKTSKFLTFLNVVFWRHNLT